MITIDVAKTLDYGTVIYHVAERNADGSPQRWVVNGKCKLWKTRPHEFRLPLKHGLYTYDYLTERNAHLFELNEEDVTDPEVAYEKG